MTVEQILKSETEFTVSDLRTAPNGLYVDEECKGRKVQLKKTDIGFVVRLTNPNFSLFSTTAKEAITRIKDELMK